MFVSYIQTSLVNEPLTNTNIVWASYKNTHVNSEYRQLVYLVLFIKFGQSYLDYFTYILVVCFRTGELFYHSTNTITQFSADLRIGPAFLTQYQNSFLCVGWNSLA